MDSGALPSSSPPRRRAALIFVFVTLLIDTLSFGLIIPVLPLLVENLLGGDVSDAATWYGCFQIAFLTMQFVFTPVQGALSDRFGRRPIILLSNFGLGLDYLLMALADTLPLLFIGRLLSGITSANFSTANAYIADVTPPEKRAQVYGVIGGAFGIGLIIAPVLGGMLASISVRLPFWMAVVLCLTNFCYGFFVLPESLPPEKRSKKFDLTHANPFGALKLLRRYPRLLGLIGVAALDALAHMVAPMTFVLYAAYRFGWDPLMVGITMALSGVLQLIVQGALIKPIVGKIGERRTLIFGLLCGAFGLTLYALAPTGYWFWAMMPIAALWKVAQPAMQALMSRLVDPCEQGRLQGAVASVSSLSGIAGAILFPAMLAMVTASQRQDIWAGATYFVAALTVGIALLLACYILAHSPTMTSTGFMSASKENVTEKAVSDAREMQ